MKIQSTGNQFEALLNKNRIMLQQQLNSTASGVGEIISCEKDTFEKLSELSKTAANLSNSSFSPTVSEKKGFFQRLLKK